MSTIQMESELSKDTAFINESSDWFNQMIAAIRADEVQLAVGLADPDKAEFYKSAISGNRDEMIHSMNRQFSQSYIREMILNYSNEIVKRNRKPIEIHVYHTINTLHVWAVIADHDSETEAALFLSEAAVNANYSKFGYTIDTIILEVSDNYPVPNHFIKFM